MSVRPKIPAASCGEIPVADKRGWRLGCSWATMQAPLHSVPATELEGSAMAVAPARFEEFYADSRPRLFAALCLVTGSRQEAEELAQDAFLRVWERWERVATMADAEGYLYRTAMNLFRRRYRRARIAARLASDAPARDDVFATVDDRDVLKRAMDGLTPKQRGAVVLTAILGFSSEEAGRLLGVKDATVRVLARNARLIMRAKVEDPR